MSTSSSSSSPPPLPPYSTLLPPAFRTECSSLVRRLSDSTLSTVTELSHLLSLLRLMNVSYQRGEEISKIFVKEFLANCISAVLARSYSQSSEQLNLVNECLKGALDIVATHWRMALPTHNPNANGVNPNNSHGEIYVTADGRPRLPPIGDVIPILLTPIQPPVFAALPHIPLSMFNNNNNHHHNNANSRHQAMMNRHTVGSTENPLLALQNNSHSTAIIVAPNGEAAITTNNSGGSDGNTVSSTQIAVAVETMSQELGIQDKDKDKTKEDGTKNTETPATSTDVPTVAAADGKDNVEAKDKVEGPQPNPNTTTPSASNENNTPTPFANNNPADSSLTTQTSEPSPSASTSPPSTSPSTSSPSSTPPPLPPQTSAAFLQNEPIEIPGHHPPSGFLNLTRGGFVMSTPQCPAWLRDLDTFILDVFDLCFDPSKGYYQHYGLEKPSEVLVDELEDSEDLRSYRLTIVPMDWIDVYHNGKWKIGQVVDMRPLPVSSENGQQMNEFRINFEGLDDIHGEWLPSNSVRLARLRTKSVAAIDKWRLELEVGSVCDALDTINKWYTATIVEANVQGVKVSYDGWTNRYDEWLVRTSHRLAAHRTKALGGKESEGVSGNINTREFDDSNDTEDDIAVFRGKDWGSYYLVEMLKYFQSLHGYENFLLRIIYRQHAPIAVPLMRRITDIIQRGCSLFGKLFLRRYMPFLRMTYTETLLELSDVELRLFSKDDLEEIVKATEKLLRRFMSTKDCTAFLDKFQLDCALKRFRSPIVQRRVQGLVTLQDIIGTVRRFNHPHWWSPPCMIYFIRTNGILEVCFNLQNSHPELMRRAMELMKFFANEQKLSKEHLSLIWNAMENAMKGKDEPLLQVLYKGLDDLSSSLDSSHLDFLFEMVKQVPYSEYQVATLDLIKELARWTYKSGPSAAKKAIDLLWDIIQDESNATTDIVNNARMRLEDIVKNKSNREEYMSRCIVSIKESRSVPPMLSLLRGWIDSFPISPQVAETPSRVKIIEDLVKDGMITALFDDMKIFKDKSRAMIRSQYGNDESKWWMHSSDIDNMVVSGNSTYYQSIRARFDFLYHIIRFSFQQITKEYIDNLWSLFVTNGITFGEKEELFIWLTKTIALKLGYPQQTPLFPEGVDEYVFNDLLIKNFDFTHVSYHYYKAFESMFLFMNSRSGSIQVNRVDNDTSSSSKEIDFHVLKFDFIGFSSVWKVSLEASRIDVYSKSIGFLNRLHESLHDSIKQQSTECRLMYIDNCMNYFQQYSVAKEKQRLLRSLSLLHRMLDVSETKGVGSLRSHGTATRGKVLNLTIINEVKKSDHPSRFPFKCHLNDTIFELRESIANELSVPIGNVKLWANGHVIAWDQNVKNLSDMKIREGTLILVRRALTDVQQATLIDDKKCLVPAAKKALLEIFDKFALTNGTMTKPDFAHFIIGSGSDEGSASDDRVNVIFKQFADPGANFEIMTADCFLEFYRISSCDRSHAVWADLKAHGYRKDLRKEIDVVQEEKKQKDDEKMLPRYLLASNQKYFDLLFQSLVEESLQHATSSKSNNASGSSLSSPLLLSSLSTSSPSSSSISAEISSVVWDLLQRLPTNVDLYNKLYTLDSVNQPNPDWNSLLDSQNVYKLLYSLQILESLTEPIDEDEEKTKKMEERDQWSRKFLLSGGFKHLYEILTNSQQFKSQISAPSLDPLRKKCLCLLLKMIYSYIISALTAQRPNVAFVTRIRSESIDVLSPSELAEQEKLIEKEKEKEREETDNSTTQLERNQIERMDKLKRDKMREKEKAEKEEREKEQKEKEEKEKEEGGGATKETEKPTSSDDIPSFIESPPDHRPSLLLLGRQMSLNFSNAVLSNIDFSRCLLNVWQILLESSLSPTLLPVDVDICEPALNCIVNILLFDPQQMLPIFYKELMNPVDGTTVLMKLLLCNASPTVRKLFATTLCELSAKFHHNLNNLLSVSPKEIPLNFLLSTMILSLPKENINCDLECEEYFWLFRQFLKTQFAVAKQSSSTPSSTINFSDLFTSLSTQLSSMDSYEPSNGQKIDKLTSGILSILSDLIHNFPTFKTFPLCVSLVKSIFNELLFADNPKCKSKSTRQLAFNLIILLCEVKENEISKAVVPSSGSSSSTPPAVLPFSSLFSLLQLQHSRITKLSSWDYNPDKMQINQVGYVGLRNLGSTCYMNSLLQQFFMIPRFRYGVVTSEDSEEDKNESLLYQFQTMFSFLAASDKQSYDTQRFVHTYKDENGQPTNPRIQQDAQEFFNVLCDRLEKKLKGTHYGGLIKSLFGGKLVNQVICHGGCGKPREKDEDFYCVSLQVKSLSSMEDSLNSYVLGEQLGDFNCDSCGKKTDITKRSVIGKLSPTMIFHLKRFEINYETWQHEKLNNKFSFPMEINLEPFTKEGIHRKEMESKKAKGDNVVVPEIYSVHPKEWYEYKLFGILVHVGTAQAGHYFSFIKERVHRNPGEMDTGEGRWLEFNDNQVRPFDPKTIAENCFGGESEVLEKMTGWASDITMEKQQNAYMLVYERVKPPPRSNTKGGVDANSSILPTTTSTVAIPSPSPSVPSDTSQVTLKNIASLVQVAESKANSLSSLTSDDDENGGIPNDYWTKSIKDVIPPRVLESIKMDNLQFFNDRQIFNSDYFKFMDNVVKISPEAIKAAFGEEAKDGGNNNKYLQFLELSVTFACETLIRSSENRVFTDYISHLTKLITGSVPACQWILDYLSSKPAVLGEMTLAARDHHVRKGIVDLAFFATQQIVEVERPFYYEKEEKELPSSPSSASASPSADTKQKITQSRSSIVRYLTSHLSQIVDAPKHWMRFTEYFHYFELMAANGHEERQLLQSVGVFTQLGDLYLGEHSPLWDKKKRRQQMGNMNMSPNWNSLLCTLSILVRSSVTATNPLECEGNTTVYDPTKPLLPLSDSDTKLLLTPALYTSALMSCGSCVDQVVSFILHFCVGNAHFSQCVIDIVLAGLQHSELSAARPYFDLITALVNLKDNCQQNRFDHLLSPNKGILHLLSQSRQHGQRFAYSGIKLLVDLISSSPEFAQCMMTRRNDWVWMDQWLKDYINKRNNQHSSSTYLAMGNNNGSSGSSNSASGGSNTNGSDGSGGQKKNPTMERQESRSETFDKYSHQVEKLGGQMQISETSSSSSSSSSSSDEMDGIRVSGENLSSLSNRRNRHSDEPTVLRLNRQFASPLSPEIYTSAALAAAADSQYQALAGGEEMRRGAQMSHNMNDSPSLQHSDSSEGTETDDMDDDSRDNLMDDNSPGRKRKSRENHNEQRESSVVRTSDAMEDDPTAITSISGVVDHHRNAVLSQGTITSTGIGIITGSNGNSSPYSPGGPQWECTICTFLNESHHFTCGMCDGRRPS